MNLRSGTYLGTRASDIASIATTRESGTRSKGNLESIWEYLLSESQSYMSSLVKSKMDHSAKMNQESLRKVKHASNPFDDSSREIDYDVPSAYQLTNKFYAQIFQDPQGRYAFKSTKYAPPFEDQPLANF